MKKFLKMSLLIFIVIIVLFLIKAIFFPAYVYHFGNPFIQEPTVRCVCYGAVYRWTDYASDPSNFSDCIGVSPRTSCELETDGGWSREAYEEKFD